MLIKPGPLGLVVNRDVMCGTNHAFCVGSTSNKGVTGTFTAGTKTITVKGGIITKIG